MRENGLIGMPGDASSVSETSARRRRSRARTVDVEVLLSQDARTLVDRLARAVEDAAQHVLADGDAEGVAAKLDARLAGINARRALKDLHDGALARHFEHLASALGAIRQGQRDDLVELGELDIVKNDKRTVHTNNRAVICAAPCVSHSERDRLLEQVERRKEGATAARGGEKKPRQATPLIRKKKGKNAPRRGCTE